MLTCFWCRDREKERVKTTSSLNGPFFRLEFKNHPWRSSSSWEDRMLRQSSSFRTFTSCSKLLSLRASRLLFSLCRATDSGHTSLFPVLQSLHSCKFLLNVKKSSLFLHQRNSLMQVHCSRGQHLWPLASPPGDMRETSILYPLWGKWTKKKDHLKANRTSLFLLLPNMLIRLNYYDEMLIMSKYLLI